MEQPPGFIQNSSLVCILKKSLYGLKKELRAWYENMDYYILSHDFFRCKYDCNVYMLRTNDSLIILVLYVDDLLITGTSASTIVVVKDILHDKFSMMGMVPLHFFLGIDINQDAFGIKISQAKYAKDILDRFHMTDYKSTPTPFLSGIRLEDCGDTLLVENTLYRHPMDIILYFSHTHLDISYVVGVVSIYMQEPHDQHWKDSKRILRYVQGTMIYGIYYATGCALDRIGFTNSNWAFHGTDHKYSSRYTLSLGSVPICWSSKKQSTISLSSMEVEYRGVVNYVIQEIWPKHFLIELGIQFHCLTVIWCDNQSTQRFCKDLVHRQ
jgi:hypothetical protein